MLNIKRITFLTFSSLLLVNSAFAQNKPASSVDLDKILAAQPGAKPVEAPAPAVVVPLDKHGRPVNTPAATSGSDYDSTIVTGLDEYNNRRKLVAEKAEELKRARDEEYRRQAYEKALLAAQEREKTRMAAASTKKMTTQEYYDRQTKIMSGQK
jgi:hypothetical protein